MITPELIINLLIILVVSWILGAFFVRYSLPAMLGGLLTGVILGPPLLGIVTNSPSIELIAEFGIFFVMFYTGIEMDPKELLEHIWPSLTVALGGFILPFAFGYVTARLFVCGTAVSSVRDSQESAKYIARVKLFTKKGLKAPSSFVLIKEIISFTPNDVL